MFVHFRQRINFLGGSQDSPVCPPFKSSLVLKVSIEHCWNKSKRGKRRYPHGIKGERTQLPVVIGPQLNTSALKYTNQSTLFIKILVTPLSDQNVLPL
jgi:hypothetical protein